MKFNGPALFLAQFAGDTATFNSWDAITRWAGSIGYLGVQLPSWDGRLFDLERPPRRTTATRSRASPRRTASR